MIFIPLLSILFSVIYAFLPYQLESYSKKRNLISKVLFRQYASSLRKSPTNAA